MPKTLDEIKNFIEAIDGGTEIFESVNALILQERSKGKGMVDAANKKASETISALNALGYDPANETIQGFTERARGIMQKANESTEKLTDTERRFRGLEETVKSLTGKLSKAENEAQEYKNKSKSAQLSGVLLKAFTGKLYNADLHAKDLIREGLVDLSEDGKTIVFKDGEATLDFETGIAKYFERNKDSVINGQSGGAGGSSSSSSQGQKTMTRSAFDKMEPAQKHEFIKTGGKVHD